MSKITIKHMNHSYAKVVAEYSIIAEMYDYFSFFVEGYKFNPKFRYGTWDGKIRLMSLSGDIPVGLVEQAKIFASNMMYDIEIDEWLQPKPKLTIEEFDTWLKSKTIYSGNTVIEPYWYQKDSVFEAINNRRRVLNLPTSAGKSLIQALCAKWYVENHSDKVLILVPTTTLVDQMIGDFVDYRLFKREECLGIRSGTERDSGAKIYCSTWQSAVKQPKEWFAKFGMLMNDECFDGDTLINTPNGKKKIKDFKAGDSIYSMNEETGEIVEDEVVKLHENLAISSSEKMYELEMDSGDVIKVTGNHKFMTKNRGWVRADELTEMDDIVEFCYSMTHTNS